MVIGLLDNSHHLYSDHLEVIRTLGQILDLLKELPPPSTGLDQRRTVHNVAKQHLFCELKKIT